MNKLVNINEVKKCVEDIFINLGINEEHTMLIVNSLIDAEIRGGSSHGLVRLDAYVNRIEKKLINSSPNIDISIDKGALLVINGDNGMGQVVADKAMEICMKRSDTNGISFAMVNNSNHFGAAGYFTRKAAQRGYIGFIASNGGPTMAPWGGITPFLGTNPVSVSFPAGKYDNFTLDMAMSSVAKGKIIMSDNEGKKIPFGWAIDKDGIDTEDPKAALNGTILPFGGYKGYGIAMIIDMLCSCLGSSNFSYETESMFKSQSVSNRGHIVGALKISHVIQNNIFEERVENWFDKLKSSDLRPGYEDVLIPGERNNRLARNSYEHIIISEKTINKINEIAERLSVENIRGKDERECK